MRRHDRVLVSDWELAEAGLFVDNPLPGHLERLYMLAHLLTLASEDEMAEGGNGALAAQPEKIMVYRPKYRQRFKQSSPALFMGAV